MKAELKEFHTLKSCEKYLNDMLKKRSVHNVVLSFGVNGHRHYFLSILYNKKLKKRR